MVVPGKPSSYALPEECPQGLTEYVTSLDIFVCQIHYSADPAKRHSEWREAKRKGIPRRDWAREMEIDWTVAAGQPVYADYDATRHVASTVIAPIASIPVKIGWDFGFSPAAVFCQKDGFGQMRVLRAIHPKNVDLIKFAGMVLANMFTEAQLRVLFPDSFLLSLAPPMSFNQLFPPKLFEGTRSLSEMAGEMLAFDHVGDPAGRNRNANDGESPYSLLKRIFKLVIRPSRSNNNWNQRLNTMSGILMEGAEVAPGVPRFIVSPEPSTEFLREGLGGAYSYPEIITKDEAPKGPYSHPQDALQYVAVDYFPTGANRAVSQEQTESYSTLLNPNAAAPYSAPQLAEGEERLDPIIIVDGLPTLRNGGGWNPFLQSLLA